MNRNLSTLPKNILFRIGVPVFVFIVGLILFPMIFGSNDAGQRTVIQWPDGTLIVKFEPGLYVKAFGKCTKYNDLITFDFDRVEAQGASATVDQKGISVRYRDGGMGTIFGKSRYTLPADKDTMLELHKAFRSNVGVAYKLIKPVTEEAMNLTAGLMTSEEAYATKRAIFTQLAKEQIANGKFKTTLATIAKKDETTGNEIIEQIPVIAKDSNNVPIHLKSDLNEYGISLTGFQLNDPGFEPKTLEQIASKREATMAIITAKANAERAKQETITAQENGKRDVMRARYAKEVEKEKAIVDAQRVQEVAIIKAKQQVEIARQSKKEAEQKKLAAAEYKQEMILRGEGDAEYKKLVMEADGALTQKLGAWERVMAVFAKEFGKQKWVPDISIGQTKSSGSDVSNMVELLTVKAAKDLGLDFKINKQHN